MSNADYISMVAAAIAFGAAAVSIFAIYIPWRSTHDSEVFKESVLALERAYRSLAREMGADGRPAADRLNWLTSARHIESYKELRSSLKTKLYRRLCQEQEEHWRHEFYLCLLKDHITQSSYFENGPIEPRSAIVLYGFASWPSKREDPIDKLNIEAIYGESDLLKGNYGLQQYLQKFPQFSGAD